MTIDEVSHQREQVARIADNGDIEQHTLYLPEQVQLAGRFGDGYLEQLLHLPEAVSCRLREEQRRSLRWRVATTGDGREFGIVTRRSSADGLPQRLLLCFDGQLPLGEGAATDGTGNRWIRPGPVAPSTEAMDAGMARCREVLASWHEAFRLQEERVIPGKPPVRGLRPPQVGAFYAALAHWQVTHEPATIVMPTGTGKTETMLAILAHERLPCLLIVVPNAALRDQIAGKCRTLGLLPELGIVRRDARMPVVGTLHKIPKTPEDVIAFFGRCNVVVTTMSVCGQATPEVQKAMAASASHLFIDEAHHIGARTWNEFRSVFRDKPVLQFTATPFRRDGRHVDGKVIFNYPLRKAQSEGYFRPVTLVPVREYLDEESDAAIARAALARLEADIAAGHDHLLMARTETIARARTVLEVYRALGAGHHPILVTSQTKAGERVAAMQQLASRHSRILVCVNMFGEGFDFPELKIAAMHDVHKSLAITLQFTGRFTRLKPDLGNASVIANVADPEVEDSLKALYAEDADWNQLLRHLAEGATGRQTLRTEFLEAFGRLPAEVPLQNIFPKMSTVVFRTRCPRWRPTSLSESIEESRLFVEPVINERHKVALFVTRETEPVPWGVVRSVQNTTYDLYLLHWSETQRLLFIHSSNNKSLHEDLADAVCGEGNAKRVSGEGVFRVFGRVQRLMLMNLGLGHTLGRSVRFTMYVGADVVEGLAQAGIENKYKSNLFGRGYEEGERVTVGCSHKGRIWSYRIAEDISDWIDWCHGIGDKILDNAITPEAALTGVLIPKQLTERPALVPLSVEWPEDLLLKPENVVSFEVGAQSVPFVETGLSVVGHSAEGDLRFAVFTEGWRVEYRVEFADNMVRYVPTGAQSVSVVSGSKRMTLSEFFQSCPPVFVFERNAHLLYNLLFEPRDRDRQPFAQGRIDAWDWRGVDLRKESQTAAKFSDSIQRRVLDTILAPACPEQFDIVFDDDDKHEAADIVALKADGERLIVHFFHCKYSHGAAPGARVDDLYEVCGQTQRSVQWHTGIDRLFSHLKQREQARIQKGLASRFERGDLRALGLMKRAARLLRAEISFTIVQPGLSKANVSASQLELLGSTEVYLKETCGGRLSVIASA